MRSGPRPPRRSLDEEVVELRERGQSYSAVASALGINDGEPQEAFIRVMRSLPENERNALHARESARLDQLEVRIRTPGRRSAPQDGTSSGRP